MSVSDRLSRSRTLWRRAAPLIVAVGLAAIADGGPTSAETRKAEAQKAELQEDGARSPAPRQPAAPRPRASRPDRAEPDTPDIPGAKTRRPQPAREDAASNATRDPDRSRAPKSPDVSEDSVPDSATRAEVDLSLPRWAADAVGLHELRLSLNAQAGLARYLKNRHPLVFVVSRNGRYASWRYCRPGGRCSVGSAARKALARCDAIGIDGPCYIHSVGRRQVWKGEVEREDALGGAVFVAQDTEARGPDAARGVLFYLRGYGAFRYPPGLSYRRVPPYGHRFARAGWDVKTIEVPYYNRPPGNLPRIADLIRRTVDAAREQGYKKVVLAGQSRGAWEILIAANGKFAIDGALLVAPAAHGTRFLSNGRWNRNFARGNPAFRRLLGGFRAPRVALAFFRHDPFMPSSRAAIARDALGGREDTRLMIVDRPAGLPGHNAGWSAYFDKAWGACLLSHFEAAPDAPPQACDAKPVKVDQPTLIYSSDHLFEHGATAIPHEKLGPLLEGKTLHTRPDARHDGWWRLGADGRITIKLDGDWVRPNPVQASWEVRDNRLCVIKSPVHGRRVFCYTVYRAADDVLALVMPSQVVRLMYLR